MFTPGSLGVLLAEWPPDDVDLQPQDGASDENSAAYLEHPQHVLRVIKTRVATERNKIEEGGLPASVGRLRLGLEHVEVTKWSGNEYELFVHECFDPGRNYSPETCVNTAAGEMFVRLHIAIANSSFVASVPVALMQLAHLRPADE